MLDITYTKQRRLGKRTYATLVISQGMMAVVAWAACLGPSNDNSLSACSYNCTSYRPNGANCLVTFFYGGNGTCDCNLYYDCTTDPEYRWPEGSYWIKYAGTCKNGACIENLRIIDTGTSMPSAYLPVTCTAGT